MKELRYIYCVPSTATAEKRYGFSMVELSVVLSIIAVIIGSALALSQKHIETSKINGTIAQLQRINSALQTFAIKNGYLPCPARLANSDAANMGMPTNCGAAVAAPNVVDVVGATAAENLRIGAVPTRFLGLPDRVMLDGWGNRIRYVAIRNLGSLALPIVPADNENKVRDYITALKPPTLAPAITPLNVVYRSKTADPLGNPAMDASSNDVIAYALISLGKDRIGAYDKAGNLVIGCPTAGALVKADNENCDSDKDFIFLKPSSGAGSALYSDDIVVWQALSQIYEENVR
jgi:prepilin-type N-terminal cleavage/methylation domain-containing protein